MAEFDPYAPLVDPEQGLGLSQQPWEAPAHWFDEQPAPEPVAFEAPMVGEPQAAPDDWQPAEWFQPQSLEPVQQFIDQGSQQEPLFDPYAPDAVSGGQQPIPVPQDEPEPDMGDLLAPGMSTEEAALAESNRQMAMSPEGRAAEGARQDAQRSRDEGKRQLDELTEIQSKHDDAQEVWNARNAELQKERDAVSLELQQLSKQGVNNDHWWESRSTGQKIASYMTAIIGGLLAPHRGGKNSGIEFIMSAIDQDIATQQANLQNRRGVLSERRGLVGDLAAQNNDVLRSADTARIAALQSLDARLAAEASQYDPAGTTARRITEARVAVRQKQAEAAQAMEQKMYDRTKDAADLELKFRAERRQAAANAETRRHNMAMEKHDRDKLEAERATKPTKAGPTVTGNAVHGISFKTLGPDGKPVTLKSVEVGNDATAKKLNEVMEGSRKKIDALADIKSIGPGRNVINDEQKAILSAAQARIRIAEQQLIPGVPSDKDAAIIDRAQGVSDATAFWSALDADERQRVLDYIEDTTVRDTNSTLQQYLGADASWDYKGRSLTEPGVPEAKKTPEELRAVMDAAGDAVSATPVTTKKSNYASPFLDAARAAVKGDSDPASLELTRAKIVARAEQEQWFGRNNPDRREVAKQLNGLVAEIDKKVTKNSKEEKALSRNEPDAELLRLEEMNRINNPGM